MNGEVGANAVKNPTYAVIECTKDKLHVTVYQVTGNKGWGGRPLWVPNIKLPGDIIYYDVIEDDE